MEGYRPGLAGRARQDRHDIWATHGHVYVPLPYPRARRYDDDAQLYDYGFSDARPVTRARTSAPQSFAHWANDRGAYFLRTESLYINHVYVTNIRMPTRTTPVAGAASPARSR